jgi:hypothetical protein
MHDVNAEIKKAKTLLKKESHVRELPYNMWRKWIYTKKVFISEKSHLKVA